MKKAALLIAFSLTGPGLLAQQFIPRENLTAASRTLRSKSKLDVRILGIGGANTDVENLTKGGANVSLGCILAMGKEKRNQVYLMYNGRAGNTSDTANLHKTFLFPDIGKRLFTIGYQYILNRQSEWINFAPFAEFSWNRLVLTDDSNRSSFHSISTMWGCKVLIFKDDIPVGDTKFNCNLIFIPYINIISVDGKYYTGDDVYNSMLGEKNLPPTFRTIGLQTIFQLSNFSIFANIKQVLNKSDQFRHADLKENNIVIGTLINTDIFKF